MTESTAAPTLVARSARLDSVDLVRGLIMVVMALDHVRDYFHFSSLHGMDPVDLTQTTPAIFLTRWITHFCAPLFSFLAGAGVFLSASRGKSKASVSWFLVTRGLWLILLELTFVNWAWNFGFDLHRNWGLVLWALGWSMIALAALIHLPLRGIAAIAVIMIFGHNALDGIKPEAWGGAAWLWQILHAPGTFPIGSSFTFWVYYPLIPWIGIMAAGYAFGAVLKLEPEQRRRWLWRLGGGLILAFVVLRFTNLYGDARPWTAHPRAGFTFLSFLDCSKYPPSLCYLLMTLGPGLLLLAVFDRGVPRWLQPVLVFGRVPFFYYMLHLPLLHGLAYVVNVIRHGPDHGNFSAFSSVPIPPNAGVGLFLTYVAWAVVIFLLYPLCRWFADYKLRHRDVT